MHLDGVLVPWVVPGGRTLAGMRGFFVLYQNNLEEMIYIENNSLSLLHTINAYGRDKQNQGSACGEEENQPLAGRPTGRYPINSIKVVHQFITTGHSNSTQNS